MCASKSCAGGTDHCCSSQHCRGDGDGDDRAGAGGGATGDMALEQRVRPCHNYTANLVSETSGGEGEYRYGHGRVSEHASALLNVCTICML